MDRTNHLRVAAIAIFTTVALASASCASESSDSILVPEERTSAPSTSAEAENFAVYSDFTSLPDGTAPSTFATGQAASVAPVPDPSMNLRIANGKLTFAPSIDGPAAAYFRTGDLGKPVTSMGMRWTFTAQPGGTPGVAAMAITDRLADPLGGASPLMPLHFIVTRDGWNYSVSPGTSGGGAELITLAAGTFNSPLAEDGNTIHEVRICIQGNTATIDLPDGNRQDVQDPRIEAWASRHAFFEPYTDRALTDSITGFTEVWVGL
ncbi:hypothetical protein [Rhodococcus sp. IEGM 1330]|uniref:hypothetical protein n=1 Tax=Rhodococcus sp. IEGM 1330 TaxID=3082225 RepID=UPI002953A25A|nr:hypothetical protein [Rhodococcus sp. IEGM 1330]MDV8023682.1 hypothetical protein [Rhodococcus sp. IEGM 1330]